MEQYGKKLKEQPVNLVLDLGRPVKKVAKELGIHGNTLYKWINQYQNHYEHAFPGNGKLRPKNVADLQEENAIPKKGRGHLRQTPEVAYKFIYQHRFQFWVQKMCKVL